MGYDCTLHAIDAAAVRRFDRWFSGVGKPAPAFERLYEGTAWRAEVLDALGAGQDIGRALMKGLLLWCATAGPHVASRGFAVSLWDRAGFDVDWPAELCSGSINELLPKTRAAYPAPMDLCPRFRGHGEAGCFIAADKVPAARAFVASVLERLPGEHVRLEPLLDVLTVAETRGLAYWEGVDVPVTQAKQAWLDAARPRPEVRVDLIELNLSSAQLVACGDDWLLFTQYAPQRRSVLVERPGGEAVSRAFEGVFLFNATPAGARVLVGWGDFGGGPRRLYRFDLDTDGPEALPVELDAAGWSPHSDPYIAPLGADVWLVAPCGYPAGHAPVVLREGVVESSGLPVSEGRPFGTGSFGWCPVAEGVALLEWDRQAYLWREGAFSPLGCELSLEAVASGWPVDDGCLALVDRALTRVGLDGARAPVAADVCNVMYATRGPGGAWVLTLGDNKQGDLFRVLWPNGEQTRGTRARFGRLQTRPLVCVDGVIWSQDGGTGRRIGWDEVVRLKRSARKT